MMIYLIFFILLLAALVLLLVPVWRTNELPLEQRRLFIAVVSAVFIIGLFGLYYVLGAPGIVPLMAERDKQMAMLQKAILEESDVITANPKDLAAWVGLGQSYMATGQYKNAANAFKQAVSLSRNNPLIMLAYASALISDAGGKITDEAKKSLKMVLRQQPQNPEARYLLALRMLQDGKNAEGMKNMKELYHSLPDESPLKAIIDRQTGKN